MSAKGLQFPPPSPLSNPLIRYYALVVLALDIIQVVILAYITLGLKFYNRSCDIPVALLLLFLLPVIR